IDEQRQVPVVVTTAQQLTSWRQTARANGGEGAQLVPDFFCLPWHEGHISLGIHGERCLVRFDRWRGAAGGKDFILSLVRQQLAHSTDGPERSVHVYIHDDGRSEPESAVSAVVDKGWALHPGVDLYRPHH